MTKKTKNGLIIGGTSVLCAALAIPITAQFAKPEAPAKDALTESRPAPVITAAISTTAAPPSEPAVIETAEPDNSPAPQPENAPEETPDDNTEYIEIDRSFAPPEKTDDEPPAPPVIDDEAALTNPAAPPEYKPEQTEPAPAPAPSNIPKHGDIKDGFIYINGFGWVADEGGGGAGSTDDGMYQNGNKIGTFG